MVVLDCGCGKATIAIGLCDSVPSARVVGVDIEEDSLPDARRYLASIGRNNCTDITRVPCSYKECIKIGHLTLVAVRVGDDPALGRLAGDLGQSVEAPRTL